MKPKSRLRKWSAILTKYFVRRTYSKKKIEIIWSRLRSCKLKETPSVMRQRRSTTWESRPGSNGNDLAISLRRKFRGLKLDSNRSSTKMPKSRKTKCSRTESIGSLMKKKINFASAYKNWSQKKVISQSRRKHARIALRSSMRRKITTGRAAHISLSGVARCGGAVASGALTLQGASSPNTNQKTTSMRKNNSAATKRNKRSSGASVARNWAIESSSAHVTRTTRRWHHVSWSKNAFRRSKILESCTPTQLLTQLILSWSRWWSHYRSMMMGTSTSPRTFNILLWGESWISTTITTIALMTTFLFRSLSLIMSELNSWMTERIWTLRPLEMKKKISLLLRVRACPLLSQRWKRIHEQMRSLHTML